MQQNNPLIQQNSKATLYCIVNTLQYLTVSLAELTPSNQKDPNQPVMTAADVERMHGLVNSVKTAAEVCFGQVCEEERRG